MIPLLDLKSHYSIKKAYGTPEQVVLRAKELGSEWVALTDYHSISGCVAFVKACKDAKLNPILGSTLNTKDGKLICLAKNLDGWKALIKLISNSYKQGYDKVNETPYSSIEEIQEHSANLVVIVGFTEDVVSKSCFSKVVYHESREVILENLDSNPILKLKELDNIFPHFYVGLLPQKEAYADWWNEVSRDFGKTVILTQAHYVDDHEIFKLLLCAKLKTIMSRFDKVALEREPELLRFSKDEFGLNQIDGFSDDEIRNTNSIISEFTSYDILSQPRLPKYECPNNQEPIEYLKELCRDGWRKLLIPSGKLKEKQAEYLERIKYELGVIEECGLASYFLIMADIMRWNKEQGWLQGLSRGSAGGCLISYLTGITKIDPVEYGLLFSRFFSSARKGSLPDIDSDFPASKRQFVIDYIRNKYGHDKVCHMVTFSEFKGASAIKEVLRVHDVCPFDVMNEITKSIPEEGKIADQMEALGEDSILGFTLKYQPDKLKDWVRYENDKICGDYAKWFEFAIKLEGTIQGTGKHASAVVVFEEPLSNVCPMISDKSSEHALAGYDMKAAEGIGLVKIDCLGLSTLCLLMTTQDIINSRKSYYEKLYASNSKC